MKYPILWMIFLAIIRMFHFRFTQFFRLQGFGGVSFGRSQKFSVTRTLFDSKKTSSHALLWLDKKTGEISMIESILDPSCLWWRRNGSLSRRFEWALVDYFECMIMIFALNLRNILMLEMQTIYFVWQCLMAKIVFCSKTHLCQCQCLSFTNILWYILIDLYLAILLVTFLGWLSDPFNGESWPATRGSKGCFELPDTFRFSIWH